MSLGLPEGFERRERGREVLIAPPEWIETFVAAGLDREQGWQGHLRDSARGPGRGGTGVVRIGEPPRSIRLKRMRRGGIAATLWRDRFPGRRRLLDNLGVPLEASRRGVSTPAPLALLLVQGPPGLYRGWLALEEVDGASDLLTLFCSRRPPSRDGLAAALVAVRRMHDVGVEHPDLNLGNLLIRSDGLPKGYVIDLDRAQLHDEALGFSYRQRAIRRLERSFVKVAGHRADAAATRDLLYELYAGADERLASSLARGRAAGNRLIAVHRLGWRR